MRLGAFSLIAFGLLGVAFFYLTDPKYGYGFRIDGTASSNVLDAVRIAWPGTIIGWGVCGIVVFVGLVLLMRRSV
ncbi:MAG TPA: hypothetical protein PK402_09795 [Tepidisphaeraceae bacterium]|nr:hypothetical protein [Tepidisphaeraceae bacterium]